MAAGSSSAEERYQQAIVHAVLRSVVHDLNNPLGTITMAAAALRTTDDAAERAELIDLIEREAIRAGSTASTAAERTAVIPTSGATTVTDLVDAVRDRCRAAGAEVTFTVTDDHGTAFAADPVLLPHAVAALVIDADGSPGREGPVRVEFGVAADTLEVSIADDGAPVSAERARRPFLPFAADATEPPRGFGLAVAAARTHVRRLGGRVELVPGADGGNTVSVRMPLVEATIPPSAEASDTEVAQVSGNGRRRHVLVIDDDRTMRDMLEIVLRREGWDTTAAADGATAAERVTEQPIDLVLLDLHVGAEHGPDIAARLERQRPGLAQRIVYLSGDVPSSGRIDERPAIAKPFVLEELYRLADAVSSTEGPL